MLRYSYILRLGYRVEGPEQSDHSDAPDLSDDDSFMNLDSPIPSPKAPQDYDSELELPTVEWRSPSPLEYIPDSDLPSTQIGPLLQSVPETEDLADHDEQENGSSAPATMPDAVSSAPTSSESAPPGITVTPNLGAEPTARRSGRKRKEREELKDLSAALSACICGSSAAPLDSSEHPNVAITWYDVVGWSSPRGLKNKNRHMFRHSQNGTPLDQSDQLEQNYNFPHWRSPTLLELIHTTCGFSLKWSFRSNNHPGSLIANVWWRCLEGSWVCAHNEHAVGGPAGSDSSIGVQCRGCEGVHGTLGEPGEVDARR
ncbi:hypothetical protein B0H10DRAFT_1971562 [Mycena sp. CBHHK59/15]|nr:hypothetical protein B0H10DRAFT_1971562 [Mycena sp. CBHHK59/15]